MNKKPITLILMFALCIIILTISISVIVKEYPAVTPPYTSSEPTQTVDSTPSPEVTSTPTPTPVITPTLTVTPTPVITPTPTVKPTPTPVVTPTPTVKPTATPVVTTTPTVKPTATPVVTTTPTVKPTATPVVTPTPTVKPTPTPVVTPTPTVKPTPTPVVTPTPTVKPTATPVVTPTPTVKPTATPVVTPTPTVKPTPTPSQIVLLMPEASGTAVKSNTSAIIDYSNASDGYVMVKFIKEVSVKLKVQITKNTTYTYTIAQGEWAVLPLTEGGGQYQIKVFKNVEGTTYSTVLSAKFNTTITDEFSPYLRPNHWVNYIDAPNTISMGASITAGKTSTLAKIEAVFDYVINTLSYDYDKAEIVTGDYVPNLDITLATKKGICSDYSALMTAMLRTQGIPCKLVVGYRNTAYHAWISVWSSESGWIDNAIQFNGKSWVFMDPTVSDTTGKTALKGTYTQSFVY